MSGQTFRPSPNFKHMKKYQKANVHLSSLVEDTTSTSPVEEAQAQEPKLTEQAVEQPTLEVKLEPFLSYPPHPFDDQPPHSFEEQPPLPPDIKPSLFDVKPPMPLHIYPPLPPNPPPVDVKEEKDVDQNQYAESSHMQYMDYEQSMPAEMQREEIMCRDYNVGCKRPVCKFVHGSISEKEHFFRTGYLPKHTTAHIKNYFPLIVPPPPPPVQEPASDVSRVYTMMPPPPPPPVTESVQVLKDPMMYGPGPGGYQASMQTTNLPPTYPPGYTMQIPNYPPGHNVQTKNHPPSYPMHIPTHSPVHNMQTSNLLPSHSTQKATHRSVHNIQTTQKASHHSVHNIHPTNLPPSHAMLTSNSPLNQPTQIPTHHSAHNIQTINPSPSHAILTSNPPPSHSLQTSMYPSSQTLQTSNFPPNHSIQTAVQSPARGLQTLNPQQIQVMDTSVPPPAQPLQVAMQAPYQSLQMPMQALQAPQYMQAQPAVPVVNDIYANPTPGTSSSTNTAWLNSTPSTSYQQNQTVKSCSGCEINDFRLKYNMNKNEKLRRENEAMDKKLSELAVKKQVIYVLLAKVFQSNRSWGTTTSADVDRQRALMEQLSVLLSAGEL